MNGAKSYEAVLRQRLARGLDVTENVIVKVDCEISTFTTFSSEWMEKYVKANNKHSEFQNKESMLRSNLLPYFGNLQLDKINNRNIEEYKAKKVKNGLSHKTINNHLTMLRKCLGTAQEWNLLEHLPRIKMLRVNPPKTTYLSSGECNQLLKHSEDQWYEMIYVALNTGLRFGELTALKWCDIDFERKILTIQRAVYRGVLGTTKSNKVRKIPLNDDVLKILSLKTATSGYIFCHKDGSILTHSSCRKKIKYIAKQAGIGNICWHDLRHAFSSKLANSGVAIQQIKALLGHSDIKTTMRYAHISPTSLVEAISKLYDQNIVGPYMAPDDIKSNNYLDKSTALPLLQMA